MNDFQKYLQENYPNSNNNDADTVALLVRAGQEFATVEKIKLLRELRQEVDSNEYFLEEHTLTYQIEKLEDTLL